jgi:hypothetical protein
VAAEAGIERPLRAPCSCSPARPADQAAPASSGVTASGANAQPIGIVASARSPHQPASSNRRTPSSAADRSVPRATSPVSTASAGAHSAAPGSAATGTASCGPKNASAAPWRSAGWSSPGGSSPVLCAHWKARGNGAMQRCASTGKAWRARPWFSASDSSSSCGETKFQSSSTCCSRPVMAPAKCALARSRETTSSWPSREPSL